jgi:hypothetical protein
MSEPAEGKRRLTDGTGGSLHEHALASLHPGRAVEELVRGRPAQDQRGRLRLVEARERAKRVRARAVDPALAASEVATARQQADDAAFTDQRLTAALLERETIAGPRSTNGCAGPDQGLHPWIDGLPGLQSEGGRTTSPGGSPRKWPLPVGVRARSRTPRQSGVGRQGCDFLARP